VRRAALLAGLLLLGGAAVEAAEEDVAVHRECGYCGMDRRAYGYSRALVRYRDGGEVGTCSLHCAVVALHGSAGREVAAVLVADRDTHELVDAAAAAWVLGGRRKGVMTQRPKWAFATRAAAEAFARAEGGAVVGWDEALAAAREDLAAETAREEARRRRAGGSGCGARVRPEASPPAAP
jgi:nitrous oxide reductase accessory protein NosL